MHQGYYGRYGRLRGSLPGRYIARRLPEEDLLARLGHRRAAGERLTPGVGPDRGRALGDGLEPAAHMGEVVEVLLLVLLPLTEN